jgi:hypothetical protein
MLPWRWRMAVGRAIGWLLYQLSGRRRAIAATNIALCFGHLSPSQRQALLQQTFADNGIGLIETAMAWWSSRNTFAQRVTIEGQHLIEQAQAEGDRCLLIIHGKAGAGYTDESGDIRGAGQALLKSHVNHWLQQVDDVLAFASALPKDGGTGAVYVLLKNSRKKQSK